jgi:hypothetical protein
VVPLQAVGDQRRVRYGDILADQGGFCRINFRARRRRPSMALNLKAAQSEIESIGFLAQGGKVFAGVG